LTEALNFGSGTSSSELSPAEYCLGMDVPWSRDEELWIAEVRREPERETVARDNCRVEGWRWRPLLYAVERELGEAIVNVNAVKEMLHG